MKTCLFIGNRPHRFAWGFDESDPRCIELKINLKREILELIKEGYDNFISYMKLGINTYVSEIIIELMETENISLEIVKPNENEYQFFREEDRERFLFIEKFAKVKHILDIDNNPRLERRKAIIDKSDLIFFIYKDFTRKFMDGFMYAEANNKKVKLLPVK